MFAIDADESELESSALEDADTSRRSNAAWAGQTIRFHKQVQVLRSTLESREAGTVRCA